MKYIKKIDIDFDKFDDIEEKDYFHIYKSIKNKEYIKKFKEFLDKNGVLDKYIHNFLNNSNIGFYGRKTDKIAKVLDRMFFLDYIAYVFLWENTDEGFDFWNSLNKKWRNYIKK